MLIPLRHEGMQGRRWPIITISLIALNTIIFAITNPTIQQQRSIHPQQTKAHLLLLAASHPNLKMPADVQRMVSSYKNSNPTAWEALTGTDPPVLDSWSRDVRDVQDEAQLQSEMDALAEQYHPLLLEHYAFVPSYEIPYTYLTANFLHGGLLHLVGNMWFFWLAGLILEDTWGRIIYPVFYLVAGVAALQFHAWFNPGSAIPLVGASGAIAALMGAFLVRFPKTKIEMLWFMLIFRIRFKAYAYWLLPLWLLMEVFYGSLFGSFSATAHWAHVGGFVFGALGALAIQRSGLEHKATEAIEAKVTWTADPAIVKATEFIEQAKPEEAIPVLRNLTASKPDALEAYALLQQIYKSKNDTENYLEATIKLCQLHLKAQDKTAAWQNYDEYTVAGGKRMPASTWLELCRMVEAEENYERAVSEYELLAEAYPTEKQALLAMMSAGRISLKKLNRPADAARFYKAASASPVPHLDWEPNIQDGIRQAEQTALGTQVPAGKR